MKAAHDERGAEIKRLGKELKTAQEGFGKLQASDSLSDALSDALFDALQEGQSKLESAQLTLRGDAKQGFGVATGPDPTPIRHPSDTQPTPGEHNVSLVHKFVVTVMVTRTTQSPLRHVII